MGNRISRWLPTFSLIFILLGSTALRFAKLTFQSLRNDEHFSRHAAAFDSLSEVILRGGIMDKHPPGHVLLLHFWIQLFGESEWSVRVPSVLAGVAAVYAMYRLGRTLLSEREGLVAAGLTAVSQMPVYFSQDARAYVFLLLGATVCALGVIALERAHQAGGATWRLRFGVLLVAVLTAYMHYFGLLFVLLLGLYALIRLVHKKLTFIDWGVPFLGAALLYLPWLGTIMTHATERSSWMKEPTEKLAENVIDQMTSDFSRVWWTVFAVAVGLHIFEFFRARRASSREPSQRGLVSPLVIVLIAWIVTPMVAAVGVSYTIIPVISARNLIIVLPALFLLGAMAISKIDVRVFRGVPVLATVAVGGLLYHLVFVKHYYSVHTKRHYRAVAAYLKSAAERADESAFIVTEGNWDNWLNYYWEARGGHVEALDATDTPLRVTATVKTLSKALADRRPHGFWAVINPTRGMTRLPPQIDGYRPTYTKKFVGVTVRRFIKLTLPNDRDQTETETDTTM